MGILEGLTIGGILCNAAAQLAGVNDLPSIAGAIKTLRASELPRNHHIIRAIRRSFLLASVNQLHRYENALHSNGAHAIDDLQRTYIVRKRFQWLVWKSRFAEIPLPPNVQNMALIESALTKIESGEVPQFEASLIETAIAEICTEGNWTVPPIDLRSQMLSADLGWFADFSAFVADRFKNDPNFKSIYDTLVQNNIRQKLDDLTKTNLDLLKRLGLASDAARSGELNDTSLQRLMLENSNWAELKQAIAEAPFGRRSIGAAASESVAIVLERLTSFFEGRDEDIANIDDFVTDRMAGKNNGLLIVTAPAGFGKSAVAANWCGYADAMPGRRVARHFCASSAGSNTTSVTKILAHLVMQMARAYDRVPDHSMDVDALVDLLAQTPPDGRELILWLDGIDEAEDAIDCFLPRKLGEKVCVIISARADKSVIPRYLDPWLSQDLAKSYNPKRLDLEKLTLSGTDQLVRALFQLNLLTANSGLSQRIFHASDQGYTLFVRRMAEDALEAARYGLDVDLGAAPESLIGYAKREYERFEGLANWHKFEKLFALLTIAKEALDGDLLTELMGRKINARGIPDQLLRWLSVIEDPMRRTPPLFSFAHPKLAEVFGRAIGREREAAIVGICDHFERLPVESLSGYALRHLPSHYLSINDSDRAMSLLMDPDFIESRFGGLGPQLASNLMAKDWMHWYRQQN